MICKECGFDTGADIGMTIEASDKNGMARVILNQNGIKMLRHHAHILLKEVDHLVFVADQIKRAPSEDVVRMN